MSYIKLISACIDMSINYLLRARYTTSKVVILSKDTV